MDARYLKENVYPALTEAFAAMAVALPDDKVEYIGKYLLQYVDRKKKRQLTEKELEEILSIEHLSMKASEEFKVSLSTLIVFFPTILHAMNH